MKKTKDISRVLVLLFFAIIFVMSMSGEASAQLQFTLNDTFSSDEPSGSPIATFENDSSGTVLLTMDINDLSGDEGVQNWYFNFDQNDAENLTFTWVSGAEIFIDPTDGIYAGSNCSPGQVCKADGDGTFDWVFEFDVDSSFRVNGDHQTSVYNISYASGDITFDNFNDLAVGGNGYGSAAQVIGTTGSEGSGFVGHSGYGTIVPEPVSSTLFLVGAATLGFRRYRKKFNK